MFNYYGLKNSLGPNGEHPLKGIVDYRRIDLLNHYNLSLRDEKGQTYFVLVWSYAPLVFDLVNQTIKPKSSSFVHVDGHLSENFTLYGLRPSDTYTRLNPMNLQSVIISGVNYQNYKNNNFLKNIESYLGVSNLQLISY